MIFISRIAGIRCKNLEFITFTVSKERWQLSLAPAGVGDGLELLKNL